MKRRLWLSALLSLSAMAAVACAPVDDSEQETVEEIGQSEQALLNWSSTGSVNDASAAFGARFGRNVSISGDVAAVTRQPLNASNLGTTQVFRRTSTGWVRELNASTPVERFPVATIGPSWVFVGEPCGAPTSGCKGRVLGYWWTGNHWHWMVQINDADLPWDFGRALAWDETSSTLAVVGGNAVRTYYVSTNYRLLLTTITEPATPYTSTGFGASVAVAAGMVAVGAPSGTRYEGSTPYRSPGYVYLFDGRGAQLAKLTGVGVETTGYGPAFGVDVSLSANGNRLAVGAMQEQGRALTAYVFSRNATTGTWSTSPSDVVAAPASANGNAIAVAIDSYLVVTTNDANSTTKGALRVFELSRFGTHLSFSKTLDYAWAPVDTNGRRVIVGQPNFFGDVGAALTFYGAEPVFQVSLERQAVL